MSASIGGMVADEDAGCANHCADVLVTVWSCCGRCRSHCPVGRLRPTVGHFRNALFICFLKHIGIPDHSDCDTTHLLGTGAAQLFPMSSARAFDVVVWGEGTGADCTH